MIHFNSIIFALLFLLPTFGAAQNRVDQKIDSLRAIFHQDTLTEPNQIIICSALIRRWRYANLDSAKYYVGIYKNLAQKLGNGKYLARLASYESSISIDEGNYTEAVAAAKRRIEAGKSVNHLIHIAGGYSDLGNAYKINALLDSALLAYEASLATARLEKEKNTANKYYVIEGRALINISETLKEKGAFVQALEVAQEVEKLCLGYKLTGYYASMYNLLGEIYLKVNDYAKAQDNFEKGISYAIKYKNLNRLAIAYELLAEVQVAQKQYKAAEQNLLLSINTGDATNFKSYKGRVSWKLAELYYLQSKYNKALEYAKESEKLLLKYPNQQEFIQAKKVQGLIYNALQNYSPAESACLAAKNTNATAQQKEAEIDICYCLFKAYQGLKKNDKALEYLQCYASLKDSLMNFSITRKITQLQEQQIYSVQSLEDSLSNLKHISSIEIEHEREISKQNQKLTLVSAAAIGFLIVLCFIFYLFWLNKRKKQELLAINQVIEEQKKEIESSLGQKEILLKEIHHRVKNNLQIILSLLGLQSKNVTNEEALSALNEGQSRIKSMALIHQKLYQTDDLAFVNVQDYVSDLVQYIRGIYSHQKEVEIQLDIEDLRLDIDTAIPLGLMLNEMLSNSFKYAFEDILSPKITIAISSLSQGEYEFIYADNGKGLKEDINFKKLTSLGLKLIKRLVMQLFGTISIEKKNGLKYLINFKDTPSRKMED